MDSKMPQKECDMSWTIPVGVYHLPPRETSWLETVVVVGASP